MTYLQSQRYPFKLSKVRRIEQLAEWGLNTPRMLYVPMNSDGKFDEGSVHAFIKRHAVHTSRYNLRTYQWDPDTGAEGWNSKHYVHLNEYQVLDILARVLPERYCMIDAEKPEDGIYAGNIVIQTDGYCIIEYCHKMGAMVRMADTTMEGHWEKVQQEAISKVSTYGLTEPINAVLSVKKPDYLFEWSITNKPSGVEQELLIFWEWRKWVPDRSEDRTLPHWRYFR